MGESISTNESLKNRPKHTKNFSTLRVSLQVLENGLFYFLKLKKKKKKLSTSENIKEGEF